MSGVRMGLSTGPTQGTSVNVTSSKPQLKTEIKFFVFDFGYWFPNHIRFFWKYYGYDLEF